MRADGRQPDELRPVRFTRHFNKYAEGSVLIEVGDTKVICTASLEEGVPPFRRDSGEGWLTELSNTELKELFALRQEAIGE